MRKIVWAFIATWTLVALLTAAAGTVAYAGDEEKPKSEAKVEKRTADGAIIRGEALGESPALSLAEAMKSAEKFLGKSVVVEGVVDAVCQKKGCWMELIPQPGEASVRVTFKDYGFFVPMDCKGMLVRAEGVFEMKKLSKEDADHMVAEGASLERNEDGTANELAFVATGVELREAKKAEKSDKAEKTKKSDKTDKKN